MRRDCSTGRQPLVPADKKFDVSINALRAGYKLSPTISTYPGLTPKARNMGYSSNLDMYNLLKHLDSSLGSSGLLSKKEGIACLVVGGYFSKTTVYRLLEEGNNLFWELVQRGNYKLIKLNRLTKVSDELGVGWVKPAKVMVPATEYTHGVGRRRAINFAAEQRMYSRGVPQARFTLQRKTGVWRRTQQRYNSLTSKFITTEYNLAPDVKESYGPKQLGNTYFVDLDSFRSSTLRKHNGDLLAAGALPEKASSQQTAKNRRKYYQKSPKARSLKGCVDVAVYQGTADFRRHKRLVKLWKCQDVFPINDAPVTAKQRRTTRSSRLRRYHWYKQQEQVPALLLPDLRPNRDS
jgi:hypothetical protein